MTFKKRKSEYMEPIQTNGCLYFLKLLTKIKSRYPMEVHYYTVDYIKQAKTLNILIISLLLRIYSVFYAGFYFLIYYHLIILNIFDFPGDLPDLAQAEALSSMNPPPREGAEKYKSQSISPIQSEKEREKRKIKYENNLSDKLISEKQKDIFSTSSTYTPSKNALMKASWFGILDNSVSCSSDLPTSNVDNDHGNLSLEVDVETSFNPNGDEDSHQPLSDVMTQQQISPLESPLRRIQHAKPTWNIDSSTQTGSSLKLNGRTRHVPLLKSCKLCVLM